MPRGALQAKFPGLKLLLLCKIAFLSRWNAPRRGSDGGCAKQNCKVSQSRETGLKPVSRCEKMAGFLEFEERLADPEPEMGSFCASNAVAGGVFR